MRSFNIEVTDRDELCSLSAFLESNHIPKPPSRADRANRSHSGGGRPVNAGMRSLRMTLSKGMADVWNDAAEIRPVTQQTVCEG